MLSPKPKTLKPKPVHDETLHDISFNSGNEPGAENNLEFRYYGILTRALIAQRGKLGLPGDYIGLNLFYRQSRDNMQLYYRHDHQNTDLTDCLWFNKTNFGANIILGYQQYISKKILIDMYMGAGVLYRENKNHDREFNKMTDSLASGVDVKLRSIMNEGNFTFGVRMGFRF